MEDQRRQASDKEAAARRGTDAQVLEDAERLIGTWNERQAKRMPMIFSPTIGATIAARYWYLWVTAYRKISTRSSWFLKLAFMTCRRCGFCDCFDAREPS